MSIDEVFDWRMGEKLAGNVRNEVIGVGKVVGKGQMERDFLVDAVVDERNTRAVSTTPRTSRRCIIMMSSMFAQIVRLSRPERGVSIRVRPISGDAGRIWMRANAKIRPEKRASVDRPRWIASDSLEVSISTSSSKFSKTRAVSTGWCNTGLEFTGRSFKAQGFSWALIQAQGYFVEIGLGVAR